MPDHSEYELCTPANGIFVSAEVMLNLPIRILPLIGRIIERNTTGQIFGASGGGKSFIAIDMGMAVATGTQWNGHQCEQGNVLYFAGEGHEGIKRRIKAWHQEHDSGTLDISAFHVSRTVVSFDENGLSDVTTEVRTFEGETGKSVALIIVDTLARHLQGDENSNKDMGAFVGLVDRLRDTFKGSSAIIIHHTGNGEGARDRSRGASSLKAACDFEIHCNKGRLTFTKMKDSEPPTPFEFKLIPVDIGIDDHGEPITSCIVQYGDRAVDDQSTSLTVMEKTGIDALVKASAKSNVVDSDGNCGALEADWREVFYDLRRTVKPAAKQDTLKQAFSRLQTTLLGKNVLRQNDSKIFLLSDDHQDQIRKLRDASHQSVHGT